jgi:predicted aconitase with swiveling domain
MPDSGRAFRGRALVAGAARAAALVLDEPLSFWGGMDVSSGRIVDAHHPQCGKTLDRRVVVMASGRGSSSTSSVLAEAIRAGTAPAAILLLRPDEIIVLGALVARELYGLVLPVVVMAEDDYRAIRSGDMVEVACDEDAARITVGAR